VKISPTKIKNKKNSGKLEITTTNPYGGVLIILLVYTIRISCFMEGSKEISCTLFSMW
jgi:hypothetical protein